MRSRAVGTCGALALVVGLAGPSVVASAPPAGASVPAIGHVFTIVLENHNVEEVTPAAAPYLTLLRRQGVTLDRMYGVSHASLTNYIAMTSGQPPNANTQADCIVFAAACIFEAPNDAHIGDQLEGAGKTWKGYMESMPAPCTHPTVIGGVDPYLEGYATRHNPFVYYRDVVGPDLTVNPPRCVANDVPYSDFATDLANHTVPNYSLIVPNTCNDAHDRGANCSLPTADQWLANEVPQILASPEYQADGMLVITFDEGLDNRGCCGNAQGGQIFTLVLSPFIQTPGSGTNVAYSHYSLLRTIEDGFGLPCLARACDAGSQSLGADVWGPGQSYTTGWTAADVASLYVVCVRTGLLPDQAQRVSVQALRFLTALSGVPGPRPIVPPPSTTGPLNITSGWGQTELAGINEVNTYYALSGAQSQKLGVQLVAYLLALAPG